MARLDYPTQWSGLDAQIMNALNYNDEKGITTGLLTLLSLVRKYEFEMDEDREPLYGIFGQTSAKLGELLD